MRGRTEYKFATEKTIQDKILSYPPIVKSYYYSINSDTHMTKLRYINNLLRFLDYKFPNGNITFEDIISLSKYDIEEFIQEISFYENKGEIKELKASTKNCIYSSLSSFFNFLLDNEYIEKHPMKTIKRSKTEQKDVVFLEPSEITKIGDSILNGGVGSNKARSTQEKWKNRDFLLFYIPAINGIRLEALREINIEDIHFEKRSITVTEKGNITKDVFLNDKAIRFIRLWMRDREVLLNGEKCSALFISNRRTRMTARAIEKIIGKYGTVLDGKHIVPHTLRRSFGTNGYRATKDIKAVADALGHKTTVPTQRYIKAAENSVQNTVKIVSDLY